MKLDKYLNESNDRDPVPATVQKKIKVLNDSLKQWKSGSLDDREIRSMISFNCCTILGELSEGTRFKKQLLEINNMIMELTYLKY